MILVLNLPTRYQVTVGSPLRTVELRQIIKEDRRVQTRVTPMLQVARVDEDLLREALEGHRNSLVDMDLRLANSLGMVDHHRVDLVHPLDGSNHPDQINSHHSSK